MRFLMLLVSLAALSTLAPIAQAQQATRCATAWPTIQTFSILHSRAPMSEPL
jgi:hypothetical protein